MAAPPVEWPSLKWLNKFEVSPTGCLIWTGSLTPKGYGASAVLGEGRVHRSMYRLFIGPIPRGMELDHLCRVRPCANPWHLEPVTPEENRRRALLAALGLWRFTPSCIDR